jgi:hypothetical protein
MLAIILKGLRLFIIQPQSAKVGKSVMEEWGWFCPAKHVRSNTMKDELPAKQ